MAFYDDKPRTWFEANFDPMRFAGYPHVLTYMPELHSFGFVSFDDQWIPQSLDWTEIAFVHVVDTPYPAHKLAILLKFQAGQYVRTGLFLLRRVDEARFKAFLLPESVTA